MTLCSIVVWVARRHMDPSDVETDLAYPVKVYRRHVWRTDNLYNARLRTRKTYERVAVTCLASGRIPNE